MSIASYACQKPKENVGKFKTKPLSIQKTSFLIRNTFCQHDKYDHFIKNKNKNKNVHTKVCLIGYELTFPGPNHVKIYIQSNLLINIFSLKSYCKDFPACH